MQAPPRGFLRSVPRWPPAVWLAGLGLVLLVRFPVKFLLEPPFLMDFEVYRIVAVRVLQDDALQLYAPTTSERMVFKYAPCWAVLFAPLGWLSAHLGAVLWSSLNVLWLLLTCWLSHRLCQLLVPRPPPYLAILATLLLVRPITAEFLLGQADLLWGVLAAAFLFCEATARRWAAALWLALAVSLKLPALLYVAYLALTRRWGTVGRALTCLAVVNLAAAWWLLPSQPLALFESWGRALLASGTTYAFDISNQSLLALAGRLLREDGYDFNLLALPDSAVIAVTLVVQAALFSLLWVPSRTPLSDRTRWILDGALLTTFMVLFSPSGWLASYAVLLYPAFLALALCAAHPQATWRRPALAMGAATILICSLMTHAKFWRFVGLRHLKGESYVYLVLLIPAWLGLGLTWYLWQHRRRYQPLT